MNRIVAKTSNSIIDMLWSPIFYITLLVTGYLSPIDVLLVYILETIIIGLFHFIKMVGASYTQSLGGSGVFISVFFLIHYSIFCVVQLYFFIIILKLFPEWGDTNIVSKFFSYVTQPHILNSLFFITLIYAFKTWYDYFKLGNNKRVRINIFMFRPYGRVLIQQLVAVFPFFIVGFYRQDMIAAIVLIIMRSIMEIVIKFYNTNPEKVIVFLVKDRKTGITDANKVQEMKIFMQQMNGEE